MTDEAIERTVGNLLRAGVVLAALLVAAGGVWLLATEGSAPAGYHVFHKGAGGLHFPQGPGAMILAGLLVLIGTPVARVLFSLAAFGLERDWLYVGITAFVFAVLVYSIATAL